MTVAVDSQADPAVLDDAAVADQLRTVVDPCMEAAGLGISIVDLGLLRRVTVSAAAVEVELGLTEPGCGFTHVLVTQVEDALARIAGDRNVHISFNWRDTWTEQRMSTRGREILAAARGRGQDVIYSSRSS